MATLTGAIGTGSKWLLDRIVGGIAATGINPNLLTFLGLVVNFGAAAFFAVGSRSEEHTSELQSQSNLVCRLLLEKNKNATFPAAVDLRLQYSGTRMALDGPACCDSLLWGTTATTTTTTTAPPTLICITTSTIQAC